MVWQALAAQAISSGAEAAKAPPAGPSNADGMLRSNFGFDNSGWNVNLGSGKIESARSDGFTVNWFVVGGLAIGALVLWKIARKQSK